MIRTPWLWFKNLFYAAFVLALLCCLAEVGLRVFDSVTGQVTRRDLYDRGMICKSWFVHHTLKPSHSFAVKNPDTETRVKVSLNSFGLRGKEPAIPKPPGVYRILCLGDEATFAPHLAEEETFCEKLRELLQARTRLGIEVINAGVPDYCPLLEYLQWKHMLLGLQPDLVILNFDMSDVGDDYQFRRHTAMTAANLPVACAHPALEMPRSLAKSKREEMLLLPQWTKQQLGGLWAENILTEKSRGIDSPQGCYLWLEDHPPDWSIYIEHALAPIAHANDLARGTYASLVLATYPAPWQVSATASDGEGVREKAGIAHGTVYRNRQPFETLRAFCDTHRIPFCDASPAYQRGDRPEQLYLKNAAAFSADGHALYARELATFITRSLPSVWGTGAEPSRDPLLEPQAMARP